MEKIISIIVPCYNVEKYIDRCMLSLTTQTIGIEKLVIILVDDCSTDNTWQRIRYWEEKYQESVIAIHCEKNGRQGRARNIGLQYVSTPYIGFVDADDWVETDMYEKLYEKLVQNDCDIAMCRSWRDFARENQVLQPKKCNKDDQLLQIDSMSKRKFLIVSAGLEYCVWNKLYKTEFVLGNGLFFPEQLAYEDHFFASLLYYYANRIYILEERLYHYFVNEKSTVMQENATHHFDILTVDSMMWDECEKRGFLPEYRQELEYQYLTLCFLTSIKMILLRMPAMPYEFFLRLRSETLMRVPDYHTNRYVGELVTDLNKILLELLDRLLDKEELDILFATLREYLQKGILRI